MCPLDMEILGDLVVGWGKCERREIEDGVQMTLLRRLLVIRRWLEWEHVRGLNNLKCCEKEVVGRGSRKES